MVPAPLRWPRITRPMAAWVLCAVGASTEIKEGDVRRYLSSFYAVWCCTVDVE